MPEWSAEQVTEMTQELIGLDFLPTATNGARAVPYLEFVLQQTHTELTGNEADDIVATSRKNPLEAWRRLQKRYDATTGGRKRKLLRLSISPVATSGQKRKWFQKGTSTIR